MIKYETKEELKENFNNYLNTISNQIAIFDTKQHTLFQCLEKVNFAIQSSETFDNPMQLVDLLTSLNDNVHLINKYKANYELLEQKLIDIKNVIDEKSDDELKELIDDYNKSYKSLKTDSFEFISSQEEIVQNYIKATGFNITYNSKPTIKKEEPVEKNHRFKDEEETVEEDIDDTKPINVEEEKVKYPSSKKDNKSLIISEIKQAIFLPYKISDLEKELEDSDYEDIQELIDEEYTLPYNKFRLASISRFKEAFKLIKKKEHGSFFDAIDLAFELMPNSLLNPAIIAACKNLDELDIYLDCLNEDELDKFKCFDIKYELYPVK